MRVFLDTNVVIDFCGQRAPFFDAAAEIIDMAKRGGNRFSNIFAFFC